ncbi:hypothetical protein RchiOBHm_Chr3g0465601 [Rosa chinensis]|uniref:Uncharacterized protein n=1 Tax=Rosa chinensis TaxID=74649 RepID=A0A2P6R9S7_ROSCH|nr:hypothetical protein RchiOBHm_Chr3g0465601 [Rosa chinensis]
MFLPLERELSPPLPLYAGGGSVLSIWKDGFASFYGPYCGGGDGLLHGNLPKSLSQASDGRSEGDLVFDRVYSGVLVGETTCGAWRADGSDRIWNLAYKRLSLPADGSALWHGWDRSFLLEDNGISGALDSSLLAEVDDGLALGVERMLSVMVVVQGSNSGEWCMMAAA